MRKSEQYLIHNNNISPSIRKTQHSFYDFDTAKRTVQDFKTTKTSFSIQQFSSTHYRGNLASLSPHKKSNFRNQTSHRIQVLLKKQRDLLSNNKMRETSKAKQEAISYKNKNAERNNLYDIINRGQSLQIKRNSELESLQRIVDMKKKTKQLNFQQSLILPPKSSLLLENYPILRINHKKFKVPRKDNNTTTDLYCPWAFEQSAKHGYDDSQFFL